MRTPRIILPPSGFSVRYETAVCDRRGRVERILQRGTNMITDFGMNEVAAGGSSVLHLLISHLHLSNTNATIKRVLQGGNSLSINPSDPSAVPLTTAQNFFDHPNDVGRVLKIAGWPELEITATSSAQAATGRARNGQWLPGFTPPGNGPFTDVGVHHTNVATLNTQFTTFNTYDTGSPNNNVSLNDSANSRWIHQRIYLSDVVSGSDLTVLQLGWGQGAANCFGKANLVTADTIPVGKRYRVTLQVFSAYTPIDITGQSLNFGPTIGTHVCDLRMHRIGNDLTTQNVINVLRPHPIGSLVRTCWWTNAQSLQSILWEGDGGFNTTPSGAVAGNGGPGTVLEDSYIANTHTRTRTFRWPETVTIPGATKLGVQQSSLLTESFILRPQSGTITKPSGWRMELSFPIHWTRSLIN